MEPRLGPHELLHVFSFLQARDLLRAAQVDKLWNEVSGTKELWRQLCLRRWPSCQTSQQTRDPQTWRQYYLCRSRLEFRMESGRPEDFTCKAIAGHEGEILRLAYLSAGAHRYDGQERSVVCTMSSDHTARAWDLQEGVEIWSSPRQPNALKSLLTIPRLQLVVTADTQGLIKVWKTETVSECASFSLPTASTALEACHHPEGPFLLAASHLGELSVLSLPHLQLLSKVDIFPDTPSRLLCSPDCQWVFLFAQDSDTEAKVIHIGSLLRQQEEEPPASKLLPVLVTFCACWATPEAARLMVLHSPNLEQYIVSTFELGSKKCGDAVEVLVQQIASFTLPDTMENPTFLERSTFLRAPGSQVIMLVSGMKLLLFTVSGLQLAAYQDHQQLISHIWVDESRVITSSMDGSLRVYMWKKDGEWPVLKSCYHLRGGSHRWSGGFTHVACDNVSIVGVECRTNGKSILRSYYFGVSQE